MLVLLRTLIVCSLYLPRLSSTIWRPTSLRRGPFRNRSQCCSYSCIAALHEAPLRALPSGFHLGAVLQLQKMQGLAEPGLGYMYFAEAQMMTCKTAEVTGGETLWLRRMGSLRGLPRPKRWRGWGVASETQCSLPKTGCSFCYDVCQHRSLIHCCATTMLS